MSLLFKLLVKTIDGAEEHMSYAPDHLADVWNDFHMFRNFQNVKSLRVLMRKYPFMDQYVELDRWVRSKVESVNTDRIDSYDRNSPVPGVGSKWLWGKGKPHSEAEITVIDVKWNGERYWVCSTAAGDDNVTLNDLSRFWEAVTPYSIGDKQES